MNDTEGHVDILVCMAGTGGTGFGTVSYLRSRNPNLQVVLVQPHPDSRLTPEHPDAQIIDGVLPAYDVPPVPAMLRPTCTAACKAAAADVPRNSPSARSTSWAVS